MSETGGESNFGARAELFKKDLLGAVLLTFVLQMAVVYAQCLGVAG
jgi:hypothetical protein